MGFLSIVKAFCEIELALIFIDELVLFYSQVSLFF
jgi:hypothetical protein